MLVASREYKVMLDHRLFVDRKAAAESLGADLAACAGRLKIKYAGDFAAKEKRTLSFLDTSDQSIALNRLVFRRRTDANGGGTEYTLKCRSPDRYVAEGAVVTEARGLKGKPKLEEDIGAPFVVRFSHSNTVLSKKAPKTLRAAKALFPALGKLERDGRRCEGALELQTVNGLEAFERVFKGPTLTFAKTKATVALILWSDGPEGRPLVAEFSFRYKAEQERFSSAAALEAYGFYDALQRLDWCLPGARTKTQFAFGE